MRSVDISNMCKNIVSFNKARLVKFIRVLDQQMPESFKAPNGVLSIAIFNDEDLAKMHGQFLNKPTPTDVITFEGDPDDDFAGEVCVSADRAKICAPNYQNSADKELCLYIAHGYLHLAGIDDIKEEDALIMRKGEALAMDILQKNFRKPIFIYNA